MVRVPSITSDPRADNRPPRVAAAVEWNRKGRGWDCRVVQYPNGPKGRRVRKHIKHLAASLWVNIQTGAATTTLEAWAAAALQAKGFALTDGQLVEVSRDEF